MRTQILQACLNGGLSKSGHPAAPISASELASDAFAVRSAGAEELHIHVRTEDGAETLESASVATALRSIRATVPGMAIGVGTGAWIKPGGRLRHRHIRAWAEMPDYASVNVGEEDAPEVIRLLADRGVGIEAGLWNTQDAERFVGEIDFRTCLRVLVEMTSDNAEEALDEAHRVLSILDRAKCAVPVLVHGEGGSVWPCVREARRKGLSTRVGLEDGIYLPDGAVTPDNAALVRAAMQLRA